jgi:hypothetical protein
MPAIQPARLKKQTSELVGKFNQPAAFIRDLHALLDMYTDHTHRSGQSGDPSPLIPTYKAPPPVMRQVWNELIPVIKRQPEDVLMLCDALWAEQNYDLKLLAARMLGQVQIPPPDPVIERINAWIEQELDKRILDGLFENSFIQLQQADPESLLDVVSAWLSTTKPSIQQAGLRALLAIIKRSGAGNIPSIFRLITPYIRIAPSRLRPDILEVLTALAHDSPAETAYLLRQNLSAPNNPDTAWLIRQVLVEFPPESQTSLRTALKENR